MYGSLVQDESRVAEVVAISAVSALLWYRYVLEALLGAVPANLAYRECPYRCIRFKYPPPFLNTPLRVIFRKRFFHIFKH